MKKRIALATIVLVSTLALMAGGKPPPTPAIQPPTQLAGRQVVLSTGVTLQFITDQNAAVNGDVFDSVFGPMKFTLVANGSVLTIPMASETNPYADGYLELKFTTATSGTFYRMVYSRGTRGAGTKTTGTFTLQ
jgi:hypothetical protein